MRHPHRPRPLDVRRLFLGAFREALPADALPTWPRPGVGLFWRAPGPATFNHLRLIAYRGTLGTRPAVLRALVNPVPADPRLPPLRWRRRWDPLARPGTWRPAAIDLRFNFTAAEIPAVAPWLARVLTARQLGAPAAAPPAPVPLHALVSDLWREPARSCYLWTAAAVALDDTMIGRGRRRARARGATR